MVGKIFLRTNFFLEIIQTEGPSLLEYTDHVVKARIKTNNYRSTRIRQGNPLPSGNALRGLLQVPMSNLVQTFPVNSVLLKITLLWVCSNTQLLSMQHKVKER